MYRCEDCGRFFEEPVVVHDDPSPSGVSLASGYDIEWYCPQCGSDQVEEAGECASCGEPIADGEVLCEDCMKELKKLLKGVADDMKMDIDAPAFENAVYMAV